MTEAEVLALLAAKLSLAITIETPHYTRRVMTIAVKVDGAEVSTVTFEVHNQ